MTYVITHGPLGSEMDVGCETASEAFSIFSKLVHEEAVGVMLSIFEIGDEAVALLKLLVEHEDAKISEPMG